ncbi:MAG: hypothetical protein EHM70_09625 [Chloroflexota bacterium]|nr:MAG: hypothetical protein EHM70_09625 [Chloroflexota bacterium]
MFRSQKEHFTEGDFRAYIDEQLSETMQEAIRAHLQTCDHCREQVRTITGRSGMVGQELQRLAPSNRPGAVSLNSARARLDTYISAKEKSIMSNRFLGSRYRLLWTGLVVIAILAVSLAFPQVRALAVNFLGLFRVEQIAILPFDPSSISQNNQSIGPQLDKMLSDTLVVEAQGEVQQVATPEEASALAGIPVRLPEASTLGSLTRLEVQPGAHVEITVDLPRVRAIMKEAGYDDIELPDELDNATITADVPTMVFAQYGACDNPSAPTTTDTHGCHHLFQMASPTVNAPADLDIAKIGEAFLRLTGMSETDAKSFSQNVDWATTLILPVPMNTDYQEVEVDGVTGAYVGPQQSYSYQSYMLIWVKDGIVYGLEGRGSKYTALTIANSIK